MAQPQSSSGGWRTCGCVAIAVVMIALLIAAGGAIWYFFLRTPEIAQGPVVRISSPTTGSTAELNAPLQVNATAEDTAGVMRIELYADGALVAVQETTLAQGSNPLVFMQNWTPLTKDTHILLARAYNRTGKFADSNVVRLDVVEPLTQTRRVNLDEIPRGPNVPLPSLNQVSQLSGVPVERLREANPGLRNTDPNVPLPGGTNLD
ncbi:MAG: Ig-like domain-containing protein, partial [Anaerolineae bacterium]|nr:Ig-like domain-containing protein [Anaerolineae bacterium]